MKKLLLSGLMFLSGVAFAAPVVLFDYPENGSLARMPGTVCVIDGNLYKLIVKFKNHDGDIFNNQIEDETEIKIYQRLDLWADKKYIVRENINRYSWTGNTYYSTPYEFDSLDEIKEKFKDKFEFVIENF